MSGTIKRLAWQGAIIAAGSVLVFLVAGEALFRVYLSDAYYVWPPGFEKTFEPEGVPGVSGTSKLTINSFGVRGDEWTGSERYRMLAIGGSTTISAYLDDSEAWPHLVQERLNEALGPDATWVGNVGRPGHATPQHALQAEKLLAQHREIDAILLLVGINDMLVQLNRTLTKTPFPKPVPGAAIRRAFSEYPAQNPDASWLGRTALARVWTLLTTPVPEQVKNTPQQDARGEFVLKARAQRQRASAFRERLPKLSGAITGYTRQLNKIVGIARQRGVRVVFLTQPTLWRDGLSAEENALLWMGGPPLDELNEDSVFYSVDALARGMQQYNTALLEVCQRQGVECIDAAAALPRDGTVFWDDAHFTERGASLLADTVVAYLVAREPLRGMARSGP